MNFRRTAIVSSLSVPVLIVIVLVPSEFSLKNFGKNLVEHGFDITIRKVENQLTVHTVLQLR